MLLKDFFSTAGYAFNDYRKALLSINLEMQIFIKVIIMFWNQYLDAKIVNDNKQINIYNIDLKSSLYIHIHWWTEKTVTHINNM